jgi:hypothetical protein
MEEITVREFIEEEGFGNEIFITIINTEYEVMAEVNIPTLKTLDDIMNMKLEKVAKYTDRLYAMMVK